MRKKSLNRPTDLAEALHPPLFNHMRALSLVVLCGRLDGNASRGAYFLCKVAIVMALQTCSCVCQTLVRTR